MNPFRKFQSQLMKYVLQHPQLKKMVEQSAQYTARNPTIRNMQATAQSTFDGAKAKMNANPWGSRVLAFVTANLLGILLFLPMIWGSLKHGYRTLTAGPESSSHSHKVSKRKEKKEKDEVAEEPQAVESRMVSVAYVTDPSESTDVPRRQRRRGAKADADAEMSNTYRPTITSSSMFDDTRGSGAAAWSTKRGSDTSSSTSDSPFAQQNVNFGTSFLVKMGDEDKFTSFLDRESMTGKVTQNN